MSHLTSYIGTYLDRITFCETKHLLYRPMLFLTSCTTSSLLSMCQVAYVWRQRHPPVRIFGFTPTSRRDSILHAFFFLLPILLTSNTSTFLIAAIIIIIISHSWYNALRSGRKRIGAWKPRSLCPQQAKQKGAPTCQVYIRGERPEKLQRQI